MIVVPTVVTPSSPLVCFTVSCLFPYLSFLIPPPHRHTPTTTTSHTYTNIHNISLIPPPQTELQPFQGPSILCYNNSVFTEKDFHSIQSIGDSGKKLDVRKAGRFGLGFNSSYHTTDFPQFVSGSHVVYFDPHATHLPGVNPNAPGKRINFVGKSLLVDKYKDQFAPLCLFGNDMNSAFEGTLFRFPLRTPEQASRSRISDRSFGAEEMEELFEMFRTEAAKMLLFLKSVESLSYYSIREGETEPTLVFSCSILDVTEQLRSHRAYLSSDAPAEAKEDFVRCDTLHIQMKSGDTGECHTQEWAVCNMYAVGDVLDYTQQEEHKRLKLVPWGGVAAPLSSPTNGQSFCFLPLPIENGLPVHTNGYFELSSNRRGTSLFSRYILSLLFIPLSQPLSLPLLSFCCLALLVLPVLALT